MGALSWIEQTSLSVFVREDYYAYFVLLILHAWGMALLVGGALAIALRVLGLARGTRIERFAGFMPMVWTGAALAILSGLGLLAGYPAKALTNPIFFAKLVSLALAIRLIARLVRHALPVAANGAPLPSGARLQAALALLLLFAGVAGGKLLLYTNTVLLTSDL